MHYDSHLIFTYLVWEMKKWAQFAEEILFCEDFWFDSFYYILISFSYLVFIDKILKIFSIKIITLKDLTNNS